MGLKKVLWFRFKSPMKENPHMASDDFGSIFAYPNQILCQISLLSTIRFSLTYPKIWSHVWILPERYSDLHPTLASKEKKLTRKVLLECTKYFRNLNLVVQLKSFHCFCQDIYSVQKLCICCYVFRKLPWISIHGMWKVLRLLIFIVVQNVSIGLKVTFAQMIVSKNANQTLEK